MFGRKMIQRQFRQVEICIKTIENDIHGGVYNSYDQGIKGRVNELECKVKQLEADRDLLMNHLGLIIKTVSKHDKIEKI